jgi:cephalosporin-C deacetylase-like acetyl esterase
MKTRLLSVFFSFSLIGFVYTTQAQSIKLRQSHENGIYKRGDKIRITAFPDRKTNDSLWVKVIQNNTKIILQKAIVPANDSIVIFESSFKKPCSVIVEAKTKGDKQAIGMVIDPQKIQPGTASPKDLRKYWDTEKQALTALPLDVKFGKNESSEYPFVCFDTEINCTGPKPARGYFARPTKAAAKSLPIVLLVHAAGVKGSWCKSDYNEALRYAKMGKGTMCFDLNAHGMLDDQPDEYYNNLEAGELKDYYISGLERRDDCYFRGMYLRLIRTIDFLTKLPEWDGKRILVIGESQGGGQALAAAGLDPRVSAVVATVPAMCDWGGTLVGRKGGWPQPFDQPGDIKKMKSVLPYFDTAHLLKDSKATIVVEIGLIDNTCPSTSVYAAINQAKGEKIIYPVTYREHSWPTTEQRKNWDIMVFNPKNSFIENYLK